MRKNIANWITVSLAAAILLSTAGCTHNISRTDYRPEISATAQEPLTEDRIGVLDANEQITATVEYKGLVPKTQYVVRGILMDRDTGKELLDASGMPVTGEISFRTGRAKDRSAGACGSINLSFTFDSSDMAGVTVVVFEYLYLDGQEVTALTDLNDEYQSIHYVSVTTEVKDKE